KAAFFLSSLILFAGMILKIFSALSGRYNACGCSGNGGDLTFLVVIILMDAVVLLMLVYLYKKGNDISFVPHRKVR
ncbi:MAG: hypothetical protein KA015_03025, partial [Spirochaetes bacterium]|nr:hypothetical protein [Spirochaetota bacterium]